MIKLEYFASASEPAPKPVIRAPVTESLRAQIARVEPDVVKQSVKQAVEPVKQAETFDSNAIVKHPDAVVEPSRRKPGSVRSTPESLRAYNREYQRKRRAAVKVDSVALASVDAA
jgi:hypothetical protein